MRRGSAMPVRAGCEFLEVAERLPASMRPLPILVAPVGRWLAAAPSGGGGVGRAGGRAGGDGVEGWRMSTWYDLPLPYTVDP